MSADAPLSTPLSALSSEEYSRFVSFYYSCSEEQDDPSAWRSANPLWSWDPDFVDDGDAGFSLGLDPVSPADGPSGFLQFIFGDVLPEGKRALLWSFRRRGSSRSAKKSHWIRSLDRLPDLLPHCDWYFGPGLPGPGQKFNVGERVKAADVAGIPCLWADIDIAHPAHNSDKHYPPDMDSAVEFLMNLPAPPTVMVDTGHGLHAYWCLTDLCLFVDGDGHAAGADLALRWHLMIASQLANYGWETDKVADLARVLRLPGTLNIKEEDDQPLVELMPWRGRRYHIWELDAICHGFVAVDGNGAAPDLGADSKSGSSSGSSSGSGASETGAKPGKGNGGSSSGSLNRELSDAAKAAIVQHYFGDVKPDGRGERRCGDIQGAASRHGDSGVGSFSISAEGLWKDFATDAGGDVIDLIMAREEILFGKVRPWLERQGHLPRGSGSSGQGNGNGNGNRNGGNNRGNGGGKGKGSGRGRGRPKKEPVPGGHGRNAVGLLGALQELGFDFRYNRRGFRPEICTLDDELARWALSGWKMWEPGPDGWGEMNEFLEASLKDRMELVCRDTEGDPLHWTDQGFTRAIHALCARMGIDPFALWLDSLPPWDGVYRLGLLFISALGAADTEVNREAARLFLAAAVQRTWRPGVKHDWMPVLVSDKQGSGKSTLVSLLMPPGREKEWYSGCGRLNDTTQRILESVGGGAIVEFAELQHSYGSFSKSFLSRQTDTYRQPYARKASEHPRPWVGIGTANDSWEGSLPDDSTGNRRFVAVNCPGVGENSEECTKHVRRYMAENRDQLWAEAIHLARTLDSLAWPGDLEELRDDANREFEESNEGLEGQVAGVTEALKTEGKDGLPLVELMVEASFSKDLPEATKDYRGQHKFRDALVAQGWERRKVGKKRHRLWFSPETVPNH